LCEPGECSDPGAKFRLDGGWFEVIKLNGAVQRIPLHPPLHHPATGDSVNAESGYFLMNPSILLEEEA